VSKYAVIIALARLGAERYRRLKFSLSAWRLLENTLGELTCIHLAWPLKLPQQPSLASVGDPWNELSGLIHPLHSSISQGSDNVRWARENTDKLPAWSPYSSISQGSDNVRWARKETPRLPAWPLKICKTSNPHNSAPRRARVILKADSDSSWNTPQLAATTPMYTICHMATRLVILMYSRRVCLL